MRRNPTPPPGHGIKWGDNAVPRHYYHELEYIRRLVEGEVRTEYEGPDHDVGHAFGNWYSDQTGVPCGVCERIIGGSSKEKMRFWWRRTDLNLRPKPSNLGRSVRCCDYCWDQIYPTYRGTRITTPERILDL